MATTAESVDFMAEFEAFAEPLMAGGAFKSRGDVLHAAMGALKEQMRQKTYDEACIKAAEEGEASGLAEGDVIARLREQFGLSPYAAR